MLGSNKIKILVVDDTIVYRKIVGDILAEMPNVEVVGKANNGKIALMRIASLKPDLLILDLEMPEVNGLEVLAHIQSHKLDVGAVMLSSFTQKGSDLTIKALELGAFDFIGKPETASMEQSKQAVREALCNMVNTFARQRDIKGRITGKVSHPTERVSKNESHHVAARPATVHSKAIGLGISTGGPNALKEMLPQLPNDLGVPVFIVQHMPAMFTKSLADSLDQKCAVKVVEASDGQLVRNNVVYIAPGGKQMKVTKGANGLGTMIRITDDSPENGCKPSVDYLFRSLAHQYKAEVTAVIMTGMGSDGKLGMRLLKRNGCVTIAQDQQSCVVYGMPKEVAEAGLVDTVVPLNAIAQEICKTVRERKAVSV